MAVSAPTTHTLQTTAKTPLTVNQKRGFIAVRRVDARRHGRVYLRARAGASAD